MLHAPVEELTEAQIEAGAKALYDEMNGKDPRCIWDIQGDHVRRHFKRLAVITVNTALKARRPSSEGGGE